MTTKRDELSFFLQQVLPSEKACIVWTETTPLLVIWLWGKVSFNVFQGVEGVHGDAKIVTSNL